MKTNISLFFVAILLIGTFSCSDDKEPKKQTGETFNFYLLCEGFSSSNSSSLGFYNNVNEKFQKNLYTKVNGFDLGSVGTDMKRYGSKIWVVMNKSNTVEVIDAATCKSLKRINMKISDSNDPQPRYITFYNDKACVCCYDGSVMRIDTLTYRIDARILVGSNPDGICTANGKIYVSNSGGAHAPDFEHTVSVIDNYSFSEVKKIEVGLNPGKIMADMNGNVYVQIRGDFQGNQPSLQKINSQTDVITKVWNLDVTNFTIDDATLYYYNYNSVTKKSFVNTINLNNESIANNYLISENSEIVSPYGIAVQKISKDIYITDANNSATGNVFCYDSKGYYKWKFVDVGFMPNTILFMY